MDHLEELARLSLNNVPMIEDLPTPAYKEQIDSALHEHSDLDIFFELKEDSDRESNFYALLSIIESVENTLEILTQKIDGSIYSDPSVVWALANWLNGKPDRTLSLILKEHPAQSNILFKSIFNLVKYRSENRVKIRIATSNDLKECNVNCLIGDDRIYKMKEIHTEKSSPEKISQELIVINFNNTEKATELSKIYHKLFTKAYTRPFSFKTDRIRKKLSPSILEILGIESPPRTIPGDNNAVASFRAVVDSVIDTASSKERNSVQTLIA